LSFQLFPKDLLTPTSLLKGLDLSCLCNSQFKVKFLLCCKFLYINLGISLQELPNLSLCVSLGLSFDFSHRLILSNFTELILCNSAAGSLFRLFFSDLLWYYLLRLLSNHPAFLLPPHYFKLFFLLFSPSNEIFSLNNPIKNLNFRDFPNIKHHPIPILFHMSDTGP
jgi:hypothetical protein